jgi:hypothetical protein
MAQTATFTTPGVIASARSVLRILAVPFAAFGNLLIAIGQASPLAKQIDGLNAISDDQLAAAGTTRNDEIRRIFGARFYL